MVQKLWVLFKTDELSSPTRVSLEECEYIDDFVGNVKERFKPKLDSFSPVDLTLHYNNGTELEKEKTIASLLGAADFINNYQTPLLIRYSFYF